MSKHIGQISGFTLLEVMAALSIIAIVLISVFKLHVQTISMNFSAKFYTEAPLLAQGKLSELAIKSFDQIDFNGDFEDEFSGYKWTVAIDNIESETLGAIAEKIKKIDVIISFNDDEYVYNLRTYKFITVIDSI